MKIIFKNENLLFSGKISDVVQLINNMQEFGTLGNFIKFQKEIEDVRNSQKFNI